MDISKMGAHVNQFRSERDLKSKNPKCCAKFWLRLSISDAGEKGFYFKRSFDSFFEITTLMIVQSAKKKYTLRR